MKTSLFSIYKRNYALHVNNENRADKIKKPKNENVVAYQYLSINFYSV